MTKLGDLIRLVDEARARGATDDTTVELSVFDMDEREVVVRDVRVEYRKTLDRLSITDPDPPLTLDS